MGELLKVAERGTLPEGYCLTSQETSVPLNVGVLMMWTAFKMAVPIFVTSSLCPLPWGRRTRVCTTAAVACLTLWIGGLILKTPKDFLDRDLK